MATLIYIVLIFAFYREEKRMFQERDFRYTDPY